MTMTQPTPTPVIPLEYEQPLPGATPVGRALRWFVIIAWLVCVIALGLIVNVDVETVIVTGPLIAILGLMVLLRGLLDRRSAFAIIGAAHIGICLLFVTLVNVWNWSPADATKPFTLMGMAHVLGTGVATAFVLLSPYRRRAIAAAARI